ncbi:MAG TPA: Rrf2 family transcriptional regulator [Steroidobacteraceae bacterium]|nr:Rrf2 family transcriptional regulator [Steroidobacteraceae bacterium]
MQLTRYTDYSIRVLTHLSTYPDRLFCIAEIAEAYGISQSHLTKVVHDLGQSGYLETVRGRNGGIRLRKSPEDINLGALVRHTERQFNVVDCPNCVIAPACQVSNVFTQATRAFLGVLDQHTLADTIPRRAQLHRLFAGAAAGAGARS